MIRKRYHLQGLIQGVGFRPFVVRLATTYEVVGSVKNTTQGVIVDAQSKKLEAFEAALIEKVDRFESELLPLGDAETFEILPSDENSIRLMPIPNDIAICDTCIEEFSSEGRYRDYFALACAECGPRYTLLKQLPYDRKSTSMHSLDMCDTCKTAYRTEDDRRFHAQMISCLECGPKLEGSIQKAAEFLQSGSIVAIKGVGGFHLLCDAHNEQAVAKLRDIKRRARKPFAVMIPHEYDPAHIAQVSLKERELLECKERPIVVMNKAQHYALASNVAPNIDRIGVIKPYTALQILLLRYIETPLIVTSANLSGEPIITTQEDLEERLDVDYIVSHSLEIVNAIDDSVVQVVNDSLQILRLGRGYAPKQLELSFSVQKPILAVGAEQKSSITLVTDRYLQLSPYLGALSTVAAEAHFEKTVAQFLDFYDLKNPLLVHDKHLEYFTSQWAQEQKQKSISVQHHYAHTLSVMAEFGLEERVLSFAFDGSGFGGDGTIWGGEVLLADTTGYQRVAHFETITFVGGAGTIKNPPLQALSLMFSKGIEIDQEHYAFLECFNDTSLKLYKKAFEHKINSFESSSVGRLFDVVAGLCGLIKGESFEGESGLLLEAQYDLRETGYYAFTIEQGVISIDWEALFADYENKNLIPTRFINTLVEIITALANNYSEAIVLTGGVFQNKTLLEKVIGRLTARDCFYNQTIPINDAGISVGQAYFAALQQKLIQ